MNCSVYKDLPFSTKLKKLSQTTSLLLESLTFPLYLIDPRDLTKIELLACK